MSLASKFEELADSRHRFWLLAGVCLLTVLPTVFIGVYQGVDLAQHVQFSTTFYNAIQTGDFYPSWAGDENLGYGGVGVRFYPPLTPFLFALARVLTGSWHAATCLVFFLFTFAGAAGVYLWAKEFLASNASSLSAAAIFAVMPYHLYQIQNGSQFAEFAGCSVIPFAFLFVTRIVRRGNSADVLGLAVSFAVLILTHLPTTVIGSLSLLIYALFSLSKENIPAKLLKLAAAVALALAASSVYWLKFATEMDWLRNTKFSRNHFFEYSHNFLLTADWFGEKQLWFINFIFLTVLFISVAAFAALRFSGRSKKFRAPFALLFFALLMCVAVSRPVWAAVPFLPEVQFPWRWLTIVSAAGSIVFAAALQSFRLLLQGSPKPANFIKGLAAAAAICVLGIYALMWSEFSLNHVPARNYENYVAEKNAALGGEWFWTAKAKEEAFGVREKVFADNRRVEINAWHSTTRDFTVAPGGETAARVATLFYPHWKASVNGNLTVPQISADGVILIAVPAQKAEVKIWFEEPPGIVAAKYVSLFTWLAFAGAGIFRLINFRRKKTVEFQPPDF
jgi:uncharacterized membrane protein